MLRMRNVWLRSLFFSEFGVEKIHKIYLMCSNDLDHDDSFHLDFFPLKSFTFYILHSEHKLKKHYESPTSIPSKSYPQSFSILPPQSKTFSVFIYQTPNQNDNKSPKNSQFAFNPFSFQTRAHLTLKTTEKNFIFEI